MCCTGSSPFIHNLVHTRLLWCALAFSVSIWITGYPNSIASTPKGKGRRRLTQAALLSTRTRKNWHPSGETRKSLTGSGECLAAYLKAPMTHEPDPAPPADRLLRLPEVLTKVPVGRASWWKGVKDGRYPAAIKLGPRTSAWRASDIDKLIASL